MLAPQHSAERGGVMTCGILLAVHQGLKWQGVFHDDGQLGVMEAELGAVVDVTGATNGDTVVHDQQLRRSCQYRAR